MPRPARHSLPIKATGLAATLLAAATMLPSCAYMQTNKNVRSQATEYKGYKLSKPTHIYRSANQWYVSATPATYGLSHDFVHDNVFRKTNVPTMTLRSEQHGATAYHSISESTAAVMLRQDGYLDTELLAQELSESREPWLDNLPHASTRAVCAQVEGKESAAVTYDPTPARGATLYKILSGLDFVVIDVPGTVAYNFAVPVLAPFVFFYEFLND